MSRIQVKLRGSGRGGSGAVAPMLRQICVLKKRDVIIHAGSGDGVPDPQQGSLFVADIEDDLEHADLVRLGDLSLRQAGGQVLTGLEIPGCAVVQHQHRDRVPPRHPARDSSYRALQDARGGKNAPASR